MLNYQRVYWGYITNISWFDLGVSETDMKSSKISEQIAGFVGKVKVNMLLYGDAGVGVRWGGAGAAKFIVSLMMCYAHDVLPSDIKQRMDAEKKMSELSCCLRSPKYWHKRRHKHSKAWKEVKLHGKKECKNHILDRQK